MEQATELTPEQKAQAAAAKAAEAKAKKEAAAKEAAEKKSQAAAEKKAKAEAKAKEKEDKDAKKAAEKKAKDEAKAAAKAAKGPTIGSVAREAILNGATNEAALEAVKKAFPDSNTGMASINWYRNQLRSEGHEVKMARELKPAKAPEAPKEEAQADAGEKQEASSGADPDFG